MVDGVQVGKSPSDLIVNGRRETLDAVTWTSTGESIEGIVQKQILRQVFITTDLTSFLFFDLVRSV